MKQVGEPWLKNGRKPDDGSPLAGDDKTRPGVSDVAAFGIATALDHLGAVVDAMESGKPIRHYAHFTTLRTVLLASTRVKWMLLPAKRSERQLRCVQIRFQNDDEQRKAIEELNGSQLDPAMVAARQKALATLAAEKSFLESRALALGAKSLAKPLDTVNIIKDLVDVNTWEGAGTGQLWRSGSAAAHGYHWTEMSAPNPGQFDEPQFNTALYAAFLMLKDAMALYESRATRHV
ncbi:hypothetical protein MTY66_00060 [Mycolicibacterium sp. TY66]|nr:hypothetical protein MTY66_00060 [Mycolicibacterium sp. TY66]BCJ83957.1 hypothetical protein MTY81_53300 [Mycolicibacterium sp. TY81]